MLGGTISVLWNIPHVKIECGNIQEYCTWNIVSPTIHCYGLNDVMWVCQGERIFVHTQILIWVDIILNHVDFKIISFVSEGSCMVRKS